MRTLTVYPNPDRSTNNYHGNDNRGALVGVMYGVLRGKVRPRTLRVLVADTMEQIEAHMKPFAPYELIDKRESSHVQV